MRVTVWSLPLVAIASLTVGILVGARSQQPPDRPPPSDVGPGGAFVVAVDADLSEPATYSVRYPPDAAALEQWRNHTSRFVFRRESSARRAHNAVAALMRDELARALRED